MSETPPTYAVIADRFQATGSTEEDAILPRDEESSLGDVALSSMDHNPLDDLSSSQSSNAANSRRGINWNPLNLNLNPLNLNLNPLNLNPLNLNLNPLNLNLNPLNLNLNPLNLHLDQVNLNPLNLNLNPLNIDFDRHRDRATHFFSSLQSGSEQINTRMQDVVNKLRSDEYKQRMHGVLVQIKNTKEYQSTSTTDYDVVFETVDMFTNMESDMTFEREMQQGSMAKRFQYFLKKERIATLLFVPILGVLVALMGITCDIAQGFIDKGRADLAHLTKWSFINVIAYVVYNVLLAFISVSCISFISPYAVGSGIPEIKSILSGIDLSRVLSKKTFVSKLIGMVCAVGSGLCLGRTGPFMHASAIIAHQMMSIPFFRNIRRNQIARYQMIIAALASGVVANFGAPIGGVLFSIEVTATNCLFGSLWKGLLSATTTAIIFYFSRGFSEYGTTLIGGTSFSAVYKFDFVPHKFSVVELISFSAIGVLCGLVGALFVFIFEKVVRFRLKYSWLRQRRIALVVTVATFSAVITYFSGPFVRLPLSQAMKQIIGNTEPQYHMFASNFANLTFFIVIKLFLTVFNVVLPIPGGAITPFIVTGAALGRLFGETFNLAFTTGVIPAGYAVIGAAGLVSGAIRALSPAIFILELTGSLSLLIPVLVCSITATAVGNFFNKPLFDTVLKIQNLPFLSQFRSDKVYRMYARDIMRPDIHYLSMTSTIKECREFLQKHKHKFTPIVKDKDSRLLSGIAETSTLTNTIKMYDQHCKLQLDEIRSQLSSPAMSPPMSPPPAEPSPVASPVASPEAPTIEIDHPQTETTLLRHRNVRNRSNAESEGAGVGDQHDDDATSSNEEQQPLSINITDINNSSSSSATTTTTITPSIPISPSLTTGALTNEASVVDSTAWDDHLFGFVLDAISEGKLDDVLPPLMDVAPSQLPAFTPLNKVFHLFTMLGLGFAFVTDSGSLVGVISKKDLIAKEL